jgi:hypothetical protein
MSKRYLIEMDTDFRFPVYMTKLLFPLDKSSGGRNQKIITACLDGNRYLRPRDESLQIIVFKVDIVTCYTLPRKMQCLALLEDGSTADLTR